MRKDVEMESSPFKSLYLEENGEQLEEVKDDGSFGMQSRKASRTTRKNRLGGSEAKSPNPNRMVDARNAHLRKHGAIPATPEQLDYRGRMMGKSSSPKHKSGGRRSTSKSNIRRR